MDTTARFPLFGCQHFHRERGVAVRCCTGQSIRNLDATGAVRWDGEDPDPALT